MMLHEKKKNKLDNNEPYKKTYETFLITTFFKILFLKKFSLHQLSFV